MMSKEHITRLGKFAVFFPEYQDRKIIGAVAGIDIVEDADKFADRNGLFVIAQSGETVIILNDEKFQPKVWSSFPWTTIVKLSSRNFYPNCHTSRCEVSMVVNLKILFLRGEEYDVPL